METNWLPIGYFSRINQNSNP